jgi:hypothetical protein
LVDKAEVYQYLKEHSDCNRPNLYEHFAGGMEGKGRKDITHKIANILRYLKDRGQIIETNIERSNIGNQIINSKLAIANGIALPLREEKKEHEKFEQKEKIKKSKEGITIYIPDKGQNLKIEKDLEKENLKIEKTFDLKPNQKLVLNFLMKIGKPVRLTDISNGIKLKASTTLHLLRVLQSFNLVKKNSNKTWIPTLVGVEEAKDTLPLQELYSVSPEDNFFFHIPFLVEHAGESLSDDEIAQRAFGYLGFYEKLGVDEQKARDDFLAKIRKHLGNEALRNSFLQQDRFLWVATADENQLFLWRLYSMLHTILFKSSRNRKLGMAVWLYEPLLSLLKKTWYTLQSKVSSLTQEEQFIVLLMANGVQLETILPKVKVAEFREKLQLLDIPIRIYNQGTDNETTIIEEGNGNTKKTDNVLNLEETKPKQGVGFEAWEKPVIEQQSSKEEKK